MKHTTEVKDDARRLLDDLRVLGAEAERLIGNSAAEATDGALGRLREQLNSAHERFSELYGTMKEKTAAGARYTDHVVRTNPYRSLAAAAGVGLLAGYLIGRSASAD